MRYLNLVLAFKERTVERFVTGNAKNKKMTVLVLPVIFLFFALAGTPASAETLSPWWHITSGSRPTYLPPPCHAATPAGKGKYKDSECEEHISKEEEKKGEGGGFEKGKGQIVVTLANLGDASTSGTVVIADKLPEGLVASSIEGVIAQSSSLKCSLAKLDCVLESAAAPYSQIEVRIGVDVESPVSGESNVASVSGGGVAPAEVKRPVTVKEGPVPFGLEKYELVSEEEGGAPDTQAGSHPFQTVITTTLNQLAAIPGSESGSGLYETDPAGGQAKDLRTRLPVGLVGNPTPFPRCTLAQFFHKPLPTCLPQTVLGVAIVKFDEPRILGLTGISVPIFNLEPQAGEPARFGYLPTAQTPVYIDSAVRSGQDYAIEGPVDNITQVVGFVAQETILWGVPEDPRHNQAREDLAKEGSGGPVVEHNPPPFFELPTSCAAPLRSSVRGDSWTEPLARKRWRRRNRRSLLMNLPRWMVVTGCRFVRRSR